MFKSSQIRDKISKNGLFFHIKTQKIKSQYFYDIFYTQIMLQAIECIKMTSYHIDILFLHINIITLNNFFLLCYYQ